MKATIINNTMSKTKPFPKLMKCCLEDGWHFIILATQGNGIRVDGTIIYKYEGDKSNLELGFVGYYEQVNFKDFAGVIQLSND